MNKIHRKKNMLLSTYNITKMEVKSEGPKEGADKCKKTVWAKKPQLQLVIETELDSHIITLNNLLS